MTHHPLPALYSPFPPQMHPQVEQLGHHTFDWAQRLGLIRDGQTHHYFNDERHWRLIARAYPHLDFAQLALVADWNTWGFCLDDLGDIRVTSRGPQELRQFLDAVLAALDEPPHVVASPIFQSVADIWRRLIPLSTVAWREQMRQTLQLSFHANIWEATNRASQRMPNRDSYQRMRGYTGAWLTYVRFSELFDAVTLPPAIQYHPLLQTYLDAVNNTIVWANDLMSWRKEDAEVDGHNLVLIVRAEEGGSVEAAMRQVILMHNDEVRRCLTLAHELPRIAPEFAPELLKYVRFAHRFMRANLDWSLESNRYATGALTITRVPTLPPRRFFPGVLPTYAKVGLAGLTGALMTFGVSSAMRKRRVPRRVPAEVKAR